MLPQGYLLPTRSLITQIRIEIEVELVLDSEEQIEHKSCCYRRILFHVTRVVYHLDYASAVTPEVVQLYCVLVEVFVEPTAEIS